MELVRILNNIYRKKQIVGFVYQSRFLRKSVGTPTITFNSSYYTQQKQPIPRILFQYNKEVIMNTPVRFERSSSNQKQPDEKKTLAQKLKQAVAEYGSTVIVFHITISLASLGFFYMLVSSGLDVSKILLPLGISNETIAKIAENAGTFAIAYGVHKVFAPVRIGITLTATPFIVRYLRKIGLIKKK